jgi:hypothetical protein
MIEQPEVGITGVVCLHCGMDTPVSNSMSSAQSARPVEIVRPQISLIRCTGCGKEAPYLADEVVFLKRIPNIQSYAA